MVCHENNAQTDAHLDTQTSNMITFHYEMPFSCALRHVAFSLTDISPKDLISPELNLKY